MTSIESVRTPRGGTALLVVGVVLIVIGVGGIITYWVLAANPPASGDPQVTGALQSLTVIGAALALGVGLVLITMGIIKRRRASAQHR